jgi:hypothetical protein
MHIGQVLGGWPADLYKLPCRVILPYVGSHAHRLRGKYRISIVLLTQFSLAHIALLEPQFVRSVQRDTAARRRHKRFAPRAIGARRVLRNGASSVATDIFVIPRHTAPQHLQLVFALLAVGVRQVPRKIFVQMARMGFRLGKFHKRPVALHALLVVIAARALVRTQCPGPARVVLIVRPALAYRQA